MPTPNARGCSRNSFPPRARSVRTTGAAPGGLRRVLAAGLAVLMPSVAAAQGPVVDVWYGDYQVFGDRGNPQTWVNIVGNVSDPDGIGSLSFRLNGGASQSLNWGPDTRRLLEPGDFNIEIDFLTLIDVGTGLNDVEITAKDLLNNPTVHNVTIEYHAGVVWPSTTTVDWSTATSVQDLAQVVDGQWALVPGGIRPTVLGYDRVVAIGDLAWDDYETTVPITIHGINPDPSAFSFPSVAPEIVVANRWAGHETRDIGEQPHVFWMPAGGKGWYGFGTPAAGDESLRITGGVESPVTDPSGQLLNFDQTYWWKVRSETLPTGNSFYAFKVWDTGLPEPTDWLLWTVAPPDPLHLQNGSMILVAHHVDATFGNVEIVDLAAETTPPAIFDVNVQFTGTTATFTWTTNEPSTSQIDYGTTTAYELGPSTDPTLDIIHGMVVPGFTPGITYHYQISSTDGRGNKGSQPDGTLGAGTPPPPSTLVSDDFSAPVLDTTLWTFVDPLADSGFTMTGGQIRIEPNQASVHDAWVTGIDVPRITQPSDDGDFEVEVKFESSLTTNFQLQGLLFEGNAGDFLRVDLHSDASGTKVFATYLEPALTPPPPLDVAWSFNEATAPSPLGVPNWLRVRREGDLWTVSYSSDGVFFTQPTGGVFTQAMVVQSLGPFAGNKAGVQHAGVVDYFFNNASPIVPEDDGLFTVQVDPVGSGTVLKSPDLAGYLSGAIVTITAVPDLFWTFGFWTGDLAGTTNPLVHTVTGDVLASAVFNDGAPPVISGESVLADTDSAIVTWQTDEPATSKVEWGIGAFDLGMVEDLTLVTSHSLTITGLTPATTYDLRITSADASGNSASRTLLFTTAAPGGGPSGIQSDDFTCASLDGSIWTYVNPLEDSWLVFDGTHVQIAPASGGDHDIWTDGNFAPRIVQTTADTDFEIEARWEALPSQNVQMQGLLVEQDTLTFIRSELHFAGGKLKVFVVTFLNNSPDVRVLAEILPSPDPFAQPALRMNRTGDTWTVSYSFDGATWTVATSFLFTMAPSQVGAFAGNVGTPAPANPTQLDYFFNNAAPIIPEDLTPSSLRVNVVGMGEVLRSPDQCIYASGETVSLTPVADPGYHFDNWSGDATGTTVPLVVVVDPGPGTTVQANFSVDTVPVASFTVDAPAGAVPHTANFTDTSTGTITSWDWDFGDGGTSTQQHPSHTYTLGGLYTVSLTVTGPLGADTSTQIDLISVTDTVPTANFTADVVAGQAPLAVAFSDLSTGSVTSWDWDFGDGGTSTQQHPSHTYDFPGTYTVALTVSGPAGPDTLTKIDYVTATKPPQVGTSYGVGAAGSLGVPTMLAHSTLAQGDPLFLIGGNMPAGTLAILAVAGAPQIPTLDLSNGAMLSVRLPIQIFSAKIADAQGEAVYRVMLTPGLMGLSFFTQVFTVDGTLGNLYATSPGLQIDVP